jgi:hypothetical protein
MRQTNAALIDMISDVVVGIDLEAGKEIKRLRDECLIWNWGENKTCIYTYSSDESSSCIVHLSLSLTVDICKFETGFAKAGP